MTRHPSPEVSQRVRTTADPIMVQMRRLLGSVDGVLSLGQGACSMLLYQHLDNSYTALAVTCLFL